LSRWFALPHSGWHPATGMTLTNRPIDPRQVIRATIVVRSRVTDSDLRVAVEEHARKSPTRRASLTRDEFMRRYGATLSDLSRVAAYARSRGLRVIEAHRGRGAVVVSGRVGVFARAFNVEFAAARYQNLVFLGHRSQIFVPEELSSVVLGVLGFDDRPLWRPHVATIGARGAVSPAVVARAYQFPAGATGRGQTIAILLPYGGFRTSDLRSFFRRQGERLPRVEILNVEGQSNAPASLADIRAFCGALNGRKPSSSSMRGQSATRVLWSMEAALDIELAGALAPGATILACFVPDNPRGKFEGTTRALLHRSRPSILSSSWSAHEHDVPPSLLYVMNRVYMFAALMDVTVCCATGDDGGSPGERERVHYPASSPYVLACGGSTYPNPQASRFETVWNERVLGQSMSTSGGFSRAFSRPSWQRSRVRWRHRNSGGRAIPDVAAKADFKAGYEIVVAGRPVALGGTSAATPTWAALIACLNQALGARVGLIGPWLYQRHARSALRSVKHGTNGTYRATSGWDPCTGLGTPIGDALLDVLRQPHEMRQPTTRRVPTRSGRGS
jgi:kumamolisin